VVSTKACAAPLRINTVPGPTAARSKAAAPHEKGAAWRAATRRVAVRRTVPRRVAVRCRIKAVLPCRMPTARTRPPASTVVSAKPTSVVVESRARFSGRQIRAAPTLPIRAGSRKDRPERALAASSKRGRRCGGGGQSQRRTTRHSANGGRQQRGTRVPTLFGSSRNRIPGLRDR
jgi:hypothetical protein